MLGAEKAPADRSALYVVTEFVEGQALRQWMVDHSHSGLADIRDIVSQIAAGLRAFHRHQMIHQNLRPENIMIDLTGTVKIIGLGPASVAGVEETAPDTPNALAGTYQYTAPEYLSGRPISWRSDQFALDVIIYEMLTERLSYGAQVARVASRCDQMRLDYQSACRTNNAVPGWVEATLRRALHPDPLKR